MAEVDFYKEFSSLSDSMKEEVKNFITLLKNKKPEKIKKRKAGIAKGYFKMSDDFDEPLEDFKEYTE